MAVSVPMILKEIGPDVGPLKKNSSGSSDSKANEDRVLPNYLRASAGSCHDFCKYGAKRDFTLATRTTISEKLPVSPNKGREPDKSNNLQKKKSLFCTSRSPSTIRRSVRQVREKEIQPVAKKVAATAKNPHKLKVKPLQAKGASNGGQGNGVNASKLTLTFKGSKKIILVPGTSSLSHKPEVRKVLKEASHLKNWDPRTKAEIEQPSVEDIPEKILFITELNSENPTVGFTQEVNISYDSLQCQKQIQVSLASLLPETEDVSYIDKEIDLVQFSPSSSSSKECIGSRTHEGGYSAESSSSSLVSFLSPSSAAEAERKSLRREDIYCESDENENESIKAVLWHQNVEQKRPTESLFNDVIEETARKLVKSRKSKVKALVDAFETLISLQDVSLQGQLRRGDLPRSP